MLYMLLYTLSEFSDLGELFLTFIFVPGGGDDTGDFDPSILHVAFELGDRRFKAAGTGAEEQRRLFRFLRLTDTVYALDRRLQLRRRIEIIDRRGEYDHIASKICGQQLVKIILLDTLTLALCMTVFAAPRFLNELIIYEQLLNKSKES